MWFWKKKRSALIKYLDLYPVKIQLSAEERESLIVNVAVVFLEINACQKANKKPPTISESIIFLTKCTGYESTYLQKEWNFWALVAFCWVVAEVDMAESWWHRCGRRNDLCHVGNLCKQLGNAGEFPPTQCTGWLAVLVRVLPCQWSLNKILIYLHFLIAPV